MKTTIEIPDELFREAKARAAMEGLRLKDVVEQGLRLALKAPPAAVRIKLPIHRSARPGSLNLEEMRAAEEAANLAEDLHHAGLG